MIVIKGKQDSNQDQQEVTLTLMVEEQLLAMPPNEPVPASGSIVIGNAAGFGFRPDGPMVNGTIVLVRSGTNDGDEVRGTFDLQISELHGGMFDQRRRR